jgi:hypothetical protein
MPTTGWDLYATLQKNAQTAAYYAAVPPVACPNDGTPLKQGPPSQPGVLFCPMGDYEYPRDWNPDTQSGM